MTRAEAWTARAAEDLRLAGSFWGGFMPLWFGETAPGLDAIMLQRFLEPAALAGLELYRPEMESCAQWVVEDMKRAARECGVPVTVLLPVPE